jgi:hypothetical protein
VSPFRSSPYTCVNSGHGCELNARSSVSNPRGCSCAVRTLMRSASILERAFWTWSR